MKVMLGLILALIALHTGDYVLISLAIGFAFGYAVGKVRGTG